MTTTAQDLVEEAKRHLFSGAEEQVNRVSGAVLSTDTSILFQYTVTGMVQGTILAIGLEEVRVWATDGNLTATTVERGVNGSTAAAHSNNDLVRVRPKFSDFRVLRAINEELADLGSPANGLFQVVSVDVTYNPAVRGYDLTGATDVIRILEARYKTPGPLKQYPLVKGYALERNMPTSDFPSGFAFRMDSGAFPGLGVHVRYAAKFGQLVNATDDVQAVAGLPASANDLPPIGAAIRLTFPREVKRNFTEAQSDPRKYEEVPPGSVAKSVAGLSQLRTARIQAEAARLLSDWPVMLVRAG